MSDHPLPPLLQGIATNEADHLHLHAVEHAVALDELPLESWLGLPVTGDLVLDIDLRVPDPGGQLVMLDTRGRVAIRTTGPIRIGDDATPIKHPRLAAFFPDGLPFSHLDIAALHAELTVADGRATLTRFELASPDLELRLDLVITLARYLLQSAIAGAVHFRFTDGFAAREPVLSAVLSLFNMSRDPAGLASIPFTGTISAPRRA